MFIYQSHGFLMASSEMSQEQKSHQCQQCNRWLPAQLKARKETGIATQCVSSLSPVRLSATLWTVAHQSPLSIEFSRQEYWSGLPFPTPDEPRSLASPALAAGFFTTVPPGKLRIEIYHPNIPSFTSLPSNAPNQAKFGYLDRL